MLALAVLALTPGPSHAQVGNGVIEQWAQVVTVTPRWLILQDRDGRQYPVSTDAVRLFVIRWPTSLDRISPTALVEATGVEQVANRLIAPTLDVYEGAARSLVSPGVISVGVDGRMSHPIDYLYNPEVYGGPFPGMDAPIQSGPFTGPVRTHIVGPLVNRLPVQIAIGGNNVKTVLPAAAGFFLSQVTPGSAGMVKPGDLVYFQAFGAQPTTLMLGQLVVYKAMPIDQFAP
jgi:hypothetical protein